MKKNKKKLDANMEAIKELRQDLNWLMNKLLVVNIKRSSNNADIVKSFIYREIDRYIDLRIEREKLKNEGN